MRAAESQWEERCDGIRVRGDLSRCAYLRRMPCSSLRTSVEVFEEGNVAFIDEWYGVVNL